MKRRLSWKLKCAAGLTCAWVGFFSSGASGSVIAQYGFTGGSASSFDPDASTAGNFVLGAALTNAGISSTSNNLFARSDTTANSEILAADTPSAGAGTSYVSFAVTPFPGFPLGLSSLAFQTAYNNATATTASNNASYVVRSSRDGFTTDLNTPYTEAYQNVSGASGTFTTRTVDLSAPAFQNLTTATEFRIYIFDDSTNVNLTPRLDTVTLNGVREPSSMGLAGIGAITLLARRRRNHGSR